MAKERLPVRKILEILRLRWEQGRSVRDTAKALGISTGVVSKTCQRALAAGLTYRQAEVLNADELEARIYAAPELEGAPPRFEEPNVQWIEAELRRPGVTLELLHLEYRTEHAARALTYSAFCRRYRAWKRRRGPVMRQVHKGGEALFVDYSGKRAHVVDPKTGEATAVELFVAVMGASNFTYVEATRTQKVTDWIGAHVRALEYLGGVPRTLVPDQLRSAVAVPCRVEPTIQRTYEELGKHYGTTVIPARPRKPRDKAKVEAGVLVAQRWILARLRNETFFSLEALNTRIRELLNELNDRPMRALGGISRRALFERADRPHLSALPAERFEPAEWKRARVHEDYHVQVNQHWYSVPFELVGEEVEVRLTARAVELYRKGRRVASHARDDRPFVPTTDARHRPPQHQVIFNATREKLMAWARDVGPSTSELMQRMLDPSHNFASQTRYRSGYGLRRLGDKYGGERLEHACARCLRFGGSSYKSVERMLRIGLDRHAHDEQHDECAPIEHDQVRGAAYFDEETKTDVA